MSARDRYQVKTCDHLGRYIVAGRNLSAGETILTDEPFVVGPHADTSLLCFNCYLPLMSKFVVCKNCAVAPVCPGDGCPGSLAKWHNNEECEFFRNLKLTKGTSPMVMVQNAGSLIILRSLLKRNKCDTWEEFMKLEAHLEERRNTSLWQNYECTFKFIQSLDLIDEQDKDLVQKIAGIIDVNSFEVRGPPSPGLGSAETLRGVYPRAALLAHSCVSNTHIAINDTNHLVCHASVDIKKGEPIYYNYTDPLKGTAVRQKHLLIGKHFQCTCSRCLDATEMGTFMNSAICPNCKTGYITAGTEYWICNKCNRNFESDIIEHKVQCCTDKLSVINSRDDKELEEYIKFVSLVLAPNHYLLLDAKQRLAGVLRDSINREPHPTKKMMKRKIDLCRELLPILEVLTPGVSRTKAITLYELHATMAQLAKKLFDSREITATVYMDELLIVEKYLKLALEMLLIEPRNSPEGLLCAKALDEYRELKASMSKVLDGLHAEGKNYVIKETEENTS